MSQNQTLAEFAAQFPPVEYTKNQVILAAGVESHYFYYLESGVVKMNRISKDGKNVNLHLFFPNSVFSLLTLVNNDFNHYDFIALMPTTVRKIPRRQLQDFFRTQPEALYELNLRLLQGLSGLLKRIESQTLIPAYNQVAGLLLYFARHFSSATDTQSQLSIKLTHQEIADWLGLTRENVSLQMKHLEKAGLISTQAHHIQLENLPELEKLAQTISAI